MAWVHRRTDTYWLGLTDGYLKTQSGPSSADVEEKVAGHIVRLASKTLRPWESSALPTDIVQIWVVGDSRWLERDLSQPIHRIAEEERAPTYRIVVAGLDLQGLLPRTYCTNWFSWLRHSGMPRNKKHSNPRAFAEGGRHILDSMQACYERARSPPTEVLTALQVPVVYRGR